MTNKRQTEPPTIQPTAAPAAAPEPHEISEQDRRSLQEAYRMIHAIAADIEEEERRNVEEARQRAADDSPIVEGNTRA